MGVELPQARALLAQILSDTLARNPNLRQEDLAARAGVHQSAISNAIKMKGKDGPSLEMFLRLVQATDTSVVQFFTALEGPTPSTLTISPNVAAVSAITAAEARRDQAIAKAWDNLQRVSRVGPPRLSARKR
jgi:transcriptional regulator with XRE-family HTH domain